MADVTKTIHVKVLTFDPYQGEMIPVPGARLLCEDRGWLWDADLSDGTQTTDEQGLAQVPITFDESGESGLDPVFTITIPPERRLVPATADKAKQLPLPEEWITRHSVARITDHTKAENPLEIPVGLHARLRVSYTDFVKDWQRNSFALPQDTARIYLADYDTFLFIDSLNPDDTLTGYGLDRSKKEVVPVPSGDPPSYPYFDVWPTAPCALDEPPQRPQAWIDPPGAPVGWLGGGSFETPGFLAVDGHGFVFIVDGDVIRRFYPDGTLCETIPHPYPPPPGLIGPRLGGLALDQYRNLFVSDATANCILIFRPQWLEGQSGRYQHVDNFGSAGNGNGQFSRPVALAVIPRRAVGDDELLAVTDMGNGRVQVLRIVIKIIVRSQNSTFDILDDRLSHRAKMSWIPGLIPETSFGTQGQAAGQFTNPSGIAADRQGGLFVCDYALHRVSHWVKDAGSAVYRHDEHWKEGSGPGSGQEQLNTPIAIAIDDKNEYVYVADSQNNRVRRLSTESGTPLAEWRYDHPAPIGKPWTPTAVSVDGRGEVYVADVYQKRVLRGTVFDANGKPLPDDKAPELVGEPWTPGSAAGHMAKPSYVCFGPDGKLWVSDTDNKRVLVFARSGDGSLVEAPAPPATSFVAPAGIAVTPAGHVFVVDSATDRVIAFDPEFANERRFGTQLKNPRGIAFAEVGKDGEAKESRLYVADQGNNCVQIMRPDGSFMRAITSFKLEGNPSLKGPKSLKQPEDVAVDGQGNLYIADTGNGRVLALNAEDLCVREIVLLFHLDPPEKPEPCGISLDDEGRLLVTDRTQNTIFRVDATGQIQDFWDLRALVDQSVALFPRGYYYPELASLLCLDRPLRAAVDSHGLLAIADSGHDRVRLVRIYSSIHVNLFELDEDRPDISFRATTRADWPDLALTIKVGEGNIFDDVHNFASEPVEDFAEDRLRQRLIVAPDNSTNAAIYAMRTARQIQKWLRHLTREAEAGHRWGDAESARTLNINLHHGPSQFSGDVDLTTEPYGVPIGRGPDAWDVGTIAHEMGHWVFRQRTLPYPKIPYHPLRWKRFKYPHLLSDISSLEQTLSEGWAEYTQLFWGFQDGRTDRIRGFGLVSLMGLFTLLREVYQDRVDPQYHFGGSVQLEEPTFDEPGMGLRIEGYFANAMYQLHRAMVDPGALFADSPSYWYGFNTHLTVRQSQRFSQTIWKALQLFAQDPPRLDRASRTYLEKLLEAIHSAAPEFAQVAQSIFELNNQLMPVVKIATENNPEIPLPDVDLTVGQSAAFVLRVRDAVGKPLCGYNLRLFVGDRGWYSLPGGPGPAVRHGRRLREGEEPMKTELFRATDADGEIRVTFTAPAEKAGREEILIVIYQPDFDEDETFSPPAKEDDLETTLRKIYLYELRAAAKIWPDTRNNFGAKVTASVTFKIQAA
jgi:DNA-binding beta-propeller fold protein YncE